MKKIIRNLLIVLLGIGLIILSNYMGYNRAINNYNLVSKTYYDSLNTKDVIGNEIKYGVTFYARIEEIKNNNLLVEGLEINDINHIGKFDITIKNDTILQWNNTEIDFSKLKVGSNIAITYTGMKLESSPAQIKDVLKITVLDREI